MYTGTLKLDEKWVINRNNADCVGLEYFMVYYNLRRTHQ